VETAGVFSGVCVVGYVCKENNNPPDFFLDVMSGDSTAAESQPGQ